MDEPIRLGIHPSSPSCPIPGSSAPNAIRYSTSSRLPSVPSSPELTASLTLNSTALRAGTGSRRSWPSPTASPHTTPLGVCLRASIRWPSRATFWPGSGPSYQQREARSSPSTARVARGSHDRGADRPPINLVSAWATEHHLGLGHVAVDDHSNEIPGVPALPALLDVTCAVVTLDAMHCQTETAHAIRTDGAD